MLMRRDMQMTGIELLSPAGDFEKLENAVEFGADAVYLSGKMFGMRASSASFSDELLEKAVKYVHSRGRKIYITCNTLPHEDDIQKLPPYLEYLQQLGVDALIIADLGVLRMAGRYAPDVAKHVSTQLGVINSETALFLEDLGADTVVLARECSMDDIAKIRSRTNVRLEAFVHGAMCVSFSGRCLLSNYLTGRDSNDGKCAQPCRWSYHLMEESRPGEYFEITEDKGTFILNSRDMCMIEHLEELCEAGVSSFKIEGRMKSAYYTAVVTNAYRNVIDSGFEPIWLSECEMVSHRPYSTGFYYGYPGQHYGTSSYTQGAEIVAVVTEDGLSLRNKFFKGEHLQELSPGGRPVDFDSPIDSGNRPMDIFDMPVPSNKPYSIIRRIKE